VFARALGELHRRNGARLLALLIRKVGRFDLAEEAMQDAYERALERWPVDGVPARPEAWLLKVAANRAIDLSRRDARSVQIDDAWLENLEAVDLAAETADAADRHDCWPDERLKVIFTCCHPALAPAAQVALALKTLCGLTTAEIARAFVEPQATTAQKIVRAKRKIAEARIPFSIPQQDDLPERLAAVLATVYFVFNEGYLASTSASARDPLMRRDLCVEALHLGQMLNELLPREPEVAGLYALMRLHHARRAARCDADGEMVALEEQDRALWDRAAIAAADRDLKRALARREPGPYQLQAAIAALHATAPAAAATDWAQIAALYARLAAMQDTPVVRLNAAVALAMSGALEAGLARIDALAGTGALDGYHLLHASRADLLRRLHRDEEAAREYRRAIELTGNDAERRFLARRLAALGAAGGGA
jgi:RNA polymerase sigma-70 factor (ECF subfamily)